MPIKVCFNNEIHRFTKLPVNLKALISVITSTFNNKLPQSWNLYYVDSEGDQVTLSHEEDYQSLLESESKDSSSAIKIFVAPKEGSAGSQTSLNVSVQSQQSLLEKITNPEERKSEDYQIIDSSEKPKSPAQEKQKQEQETVKKTSQNNREKTAQSDYYTVVEDQKLNEVQPRAYPQPYNEGHNHHKLKKILFKLSLKDLPEEKKAKLQEKLRQIEESLTPEEKARLEEKKQKWASKGGKWCRKGEKWGRKGSCSRSRSGCHSRGDSKGRDGFKLKHLYKRLASPDLPEEEKARISEKVKEIEASLTPEQKARLEEKKEKWAKKSSCGRSRSRCHSKGRGGHKLKHIFIKLSMKDVPEEKRARLTEKLKEIEESLTPEQKAEYEQKKEKWQKKAALMEEHFKAQFEFKVDEQGRPIHSNIACVNCKTVPITGVRYKCTVCPDFDLCETCEATVDHPHPVLKIKTPAMMMFWNPKFGGKHHGRGHFGGHHGHHGRGPFGGPFEGPHRGHHGHHGHHGERGPFGGPHGHHGHHGEGPFGGPFGGPHRGHHGHHGHHGERGSFEGPHRGHHGHHGHHGGRGPFGGPFGGPEGRPNKGAFKLFKLFKKLTKLQESAQKGDTEKINKLREKLAKKLPEEANKIVEPVFKLVTEKADQETLRQAVEQAKDQLASFFHPEDKEQVLRQWNHFQEMRQRHQEFKRQSQGEGHFGGKHHH